MAPGLTNHLTDHLVDPRLCNGGLGMGTILHLVVGCVLHHPTQSTLPGPPVKLLPDGLDFLSIGLRLLTLSLNGSLVMNGGWEYGTFATFGHRWDRTGRNGSFISTGGWLGVRADGEMAGWITSWMARGMSD